MGFSSSHTGANTFPHPASTSPSPSNVVSTLQPVLSPILPNTSEPLLPSHPMVTRTRDHTRRPKTYPDFVTRHPLPRELLAHCHQDEVEPTCFTQASKNPKWRTAMEEGFNALMRNGTWQLVPSHSNMNLVGFKWVFRIKRKADGSVEQYKARLVAKGFHQ